jgi:hypothetical protein
VLTLMMARAGCRPPGAHALAALVQARRRDRDNGPLPETADTMGLPNRSASRITGFVCRPHRGPGLCHRSSGTAEETSCGTPKGGSGEGQVSVVDHGYPARDGPAVVRSWLGGRQQVCRKLRSDGGAAAAPGSGQSGETTLRGNSYSWRPGTLRPPAVPCQASLPRPPAGDTAPTGWPMSQP